MSGIKPFWNYYGGKYRAAPRYPKPKHATIIEPFAGAAGYSLRYPDRNVVLVEQYQVIAEIWRYLIGAAASEIRSIPEVEHVDDLPGWVPQGARWLVGFCMNDASASPCKTLSAGNKRLAAGLYDGCVRKFQGWTSARRERTASQVDAIRHWKVIEGDYRDAPDVEATWFIDPPYQRAGVHYKHSSKDLDFPALGQWCRSRRGLVIVCEAQGADWLPFRPFGSIRSFGRTSAEAIWTPRFLDQVGL